MVQYSASEIINKRIVKATRKNYSVNAKKFIRWAKQKNLNHLLLVKDGIEEVKIPLPDEVNTITSFFGDITTLDKAGNVMSDGKCIAFSTMNGISSAINDLYREKNVKMAEETKLKISSFMRGYKRLVNEKKQKGEIPIFEGKRNLPYPGYCALALYSIKSQNSRDGSLFSHVFMVLAWNLFARSHSVASIMLNHINWENDCLLLTLPKHKGDQEGTNVSPKHIYANPFKPEICPILSLAICVFSTNVFHRNGSDWCLFSGGSLEGKFSHWLQTTLKKDAEELKLLRSMVDELGTHSFRKGAVTHSLSFPGGPSVVAAYLRAGWSLGNVQQRYIFEGEGSDQFLGRVAAGLSLTEEAFTVLPPRLHPSFIISTEKWKELYPNYESIPRSFQSCLPYLLSSLSYHEEWLKSTLNPDHPLFRSIAWISGFIHEINQHIIVGNGECPVSNIKASGVPPVVALTMKIMSLRAATDQLMSQVTENHSTVLREMPASISTHILNNFQVNGAVPITNQQLQDFRDTMLSEIRNCVVGSNFNPVENRPQHEIDGAEKRYQAYYWGGRFHYVPEGFRLKTMSIKNIWDMWYVGDSSKELPPYRMIDPALDFTSSAQKTLYSKAKRVVHLIEEKGRLHTDADRSVKLHTLTQTRISEIFSRGLNALISEIESARSDLLSSEVTCRRYGEIAFTTLYNNLKFLASSSN